MKRALEGLMLSDVPITAMELRMFSFSICLIGASILALIFGNDSALALTIGAALGVFGPRIIERIQKR